MPCLLSGDSMARGPVKPSTARLLARGWQITRFGTPKGSGKQYTIWYIVV